MRLFKTHSLTMSVAGILLACLAPLALAGSITINWSATSDPDAGWNAYFSHLSTPNALGYTGSYAPSERSATFHNISATGLYQVGISRVDTIIDNSVTRRIEGPVIVLTFLDGQLISSPDGVTITTASFDPNGS